MSPVTVLSSFEFCSLCEKYIKSSFCLTENTLHLHYKYTLLMLFFKNNRYLFLTAVRSQFYTVCSACTEPDGTQGYGCVPLSMSHAQ